MSHRVYILIVFMFGSTLLTALAAQARQLIPTLQAGKSGVGKRRSLFPLRLRKARATRRPHFFYPAPSSSEINSLVVEESIQFQIDPQLVSAIITVESGYNTNAVSPKGARGLMQLIPDTARRFGVKNSFDPDQNIAGGIAYLKHLLKMFSGDVLLTVAAYNAGEHAVTRLGGIPPFPETQDYVREVAALYKPDLLATLAAPPLMKP